MGIALKKNVREWVLVPNMLPSLVPELTASAPVPPLFRSVSVGKASYKYAVAARPVVLEVG